MQQQKRRMALLAMAVLAGCGGSDGSGPIVNSDTQTRGTLVASPPNRVPIPQPDGTYAATLPPAQFAQMLEAVQPGLTKITGTPKCAISLYYMKYVTTGGAGEATDATGAIMVPSGVDPACSGPRPVVLYGHGTAVEKAFNMANIRENPEAALVAATFAAQGFIVVAPNYAGYDVSSLTYHPYLNAEQQANDMVDAMRAAKKAFPAIGAQDSGKLVVTGYSQGGYVALAAQRAMQTAYASEFKVNALAGMSGPYALTLFADVTMAGSPPLGGTIVVPLLLTSWQKSYGGMYSSTSEVYEAQYATGIESLLPGTLTVPQLFASGKLPQSALFAADSLPGPSSPAFAAFFGNGNLLKSSFRTTYLDPFPGYYLTADAGYIDDRGYVFVMARTDDIINVAGHRLSTGALEEVLAAHPDVAECAVIGVVDELKGHVPVGLLVLKAGVQRPEEHIVRETVELVRDRIGPVAFFKTAVVVGRLPKTRSGKILRGTMRRIADDREYAVPPTIDDPKILEEITDALHRVGYGHTSSRPPLSG